MATVVASLAMLNAKPLPITNTNSLKNKLPVAVKPTSPKVISLEAAKQGLSASSALARAMFATIASSEPALTAQQIAEIADGDSRGTTLLLPIIPTLAWVIFNIFQPAHNQLNRMHEIKGVVVGIGLDGAVSEVFRVTAADAPQRALVPNLLVLRGGRHLCRKLYQLLLLEGKMMEIGGSLGTDSAIGRGLMGWGGGDGSEDCINCCCSLFIV